MPKQAHQTKKINNQKSNKFDYCSLENGITSDIILS